MHNEPTYAELTEQLAESTRGWAGAISELEAVMIARGFVTREQIAANRAATEASHAS